MVTRRNLRGHLRVWLRALADPLRNARSASRWIASLPSNDALEIQRDVLDVVSAFPRGHRRVGPGQAEALLRIDARLEPAIAQLIAQYTANYERSSKVETRLRHAVFDLVKAYIAAYQVALRSGIGSATQKRWKAVLPRVLVRLAHYKGLDGRFRLFRYGHWIPAQWREFHELYEFARIHGWQREPLAYDAGLFSGAGSTLESQYIKTPPGSQTAPTQTRWNGSRANSRSGCRLSH